MEFRPILGDRRMSEEMQQIVLKQCCEGPPQPEDFELVSKQAPELKPGQFRVQHVWNSVDPGTRSRLSGGDSYAAALPLGKPIDGCGRLNVVHHGTCWRLADRAWWVAKSRRRNGGLSRFVGW